MGYSTFPTRCVCLCGFQRQSNEEQWRGMKDEANIRIGFMTAAYENNLFEIEICTEFGIFSPCFCFFWLPCNGEAAVVVTAAESKMPFFSFFISIADTYPILFAEASLLTLLFLSK